MQLPIIQHPAAVQRAHREPVLAGLGPKNQVLDHLNEQQERPRRNQIDYHLKLFTRLIRQQDRDGRHTNQEPEQAGDQNEARFSQQQLPLEPSGCREKRLFQHGSNDRSYEPYIHRPNPPYVASPILKRNLIIFQENMCVAFRRRSFSKLETVPCSRKFSQSLCTT
ncbi:hypothetical protein D1872_269510 [compost metagenome]